MPQYLPMSAKDYYDPVPGWNFGLGVAQNIERARANRAQEIQRKIEEENRAEQVRVQQSALEQNRALINEERLRRTKLDEAEARLPGVWQSIAAEQQFEPDHNVIAPELQQPGKPRGMTTETYVEAARRSGVPLSASILGQLDRSRMSEEVFDPRVVSVTQDTAGNPLKEPVVFGQGSRGSASVIGGKQDLSSLGGARAVQVQKGLDAMAKDYADMGIPFSDAEKDHIMGVLSTGSIGSLAASPGVIKDIESENKTFQLLDKVTQDVAAFDQKYGEGAFGEYVGPIDAPVFKWKTKAVDPKKLSEADREAKALQRRVKGIVQRYRNAQFGSQLTEGEKEAFLEIVGDESGADYANALETFRDGVKNAVTVSVNDHKFSPNIARSIKQRWLARPGAVQAPAAPTSKPVEVPRKLPNGRVGIFDANTKKFIRYAE